ncbi:type I glyceraldehyde-3-phosphate dehydrogenase [Marinobacterium jannaschii]|uniref:type I glyceraldehyde-3-phosphate dehydrogenase n=1 Tax=Marinobacterium jannaschii TaxID=64970 RepID=UPI000489BCE9|nr:type I glyceraldehyde-3-phosphate dehydrogenase [Marinobacterium jannaschii]
MTVRVAINGYGRIGRNILRALYESGKNQQIEIVAINDPGDFAISAHLTRYDSIHGMFGYEVNLTENHLSVAGDKIRLFQYTDPSQVPWRDLEIDLVLECSGRFTSREAVEAHLKGGATKVLVSAPAKGSEATIVYGVNQHLLSAEMSVVSNASCTTNCLAPLAKVLNDQIGISEGIMTTIHAYTNDQHLSDIAGGDPYRSRAAALSMIPTRTGAAEAVGLVLPELNGRLTGLAVRVPTANVSLVDLSFTPVRSTTKEEINNLMKEAAGSYFSGIIEYNDLPLVSVDFNHHTASCIFDSTQTHVGEHMVKVLAWYDNEWGFSNRMLDTALAWLRK